MRFTEDIVGVFRAYDSFEKERQALEQIVSTRASVEAFCSVCNRVSEMKIVPDSSGWANLRGSVVCECGLGGRFRSFIEGFRLTTAGGLPQRGLMFERVTRLFREISGAAPGIDGFEFLGPEHIGGQIYPHMHHGKEISIRHEDMQDMSVEDNTLDIILHSDVLEHIPDPDLALSENYRCLAPGGVLLFACPIYARWDTDQIAELRDGGVHFLGRAVYHGDPIRSKGVPVFNNFGFDLFDRVRNAGFQRVEIGFEADYVSGFFSDANPYRSALMWHVMVRATKLPVMSC